MREAVVKKNEYSASVDMDLYVCNHVENVSCK